MYVVAMYLQYYIYTCMLLYLIPLQRITHELYHKEQGVLRWDDLRECDGAVSGNRLNLGLHTEQALWFSHSEDSHVGTSGEICLLLLFKYVYLLPSFQCVRSAEKF